jgi:hypothetical protein
MVEFSKGSFFKHFHAGCLFTASDLANFHARMPTQRADCWRVWYKVSRRISGSIAGCGLLDAVLPVQDVRCCLEAWICEATSRSGGAAIAKMAP